MTWQHQRMPAHTQLLPLPDDGIAVSSHPPGWLGKRWRALLEKAPPTSRDRVNRGRNYARRGRLRALDISPGAATAEVCCEEAYRPTVRVRPFSKPEWEDIVRELTADLNLIASLLEGELPDELPGRLEALGIPLVPTFDEIGFDCDCGDYIMPCTHVATVFHVLIDALDGDPFLLLTLRGRDREQLLSTLRTYWGDDTPLVTTLDETEEPVPEGPWFSSTAEVPDFSCHWGADGAVGAGLRALGPPPGERDLMSTLLPLYEAAHGRVRETIDAVPDRQPPRRRARVLPGPEAFEVAPALRAAAGEDLPAVSPEGVTVMRVPVTPVGDGSSEPATVDVPPGEAPEPTDDVAVLTERLVDVLAAAGGATSAELAAALGTTVSQVRVELVDLLELGLVYRRKEGRGVRWFLG